MRVSSKPLTALDLKPGHTYITKPGRMIILMRTRSMRAVPDFTFAPVDQDGCPVRDQTFSISATNSFYISTLVEA